VVTGPSFRERGRLSDMGLRLQQDLKARTIRPTAAPTELATLVGPAECVDGMADGHPCKGIDRIAQIPLGAFSSRPGAANDIWGFSDLNDGREYIILGLQNGTAVIDVTDPSTPTEVGTIAGQPTIWRDVKVYQFRDETAGRWKAYAYVTADDQSPVNHGIQIVDLTNLPNSISLSATVDIVDIAHNVYISNVDYSTGVAVSGLQPFVYILGSDFSPGSSRGAYFVLDVTNPITPFIVQTPPVGSTYTHDATTLIITDERADVCKANPCEILIDYSEDAVDIWDLTVKGNAHILGSVSYENVSYIHSGWWTDDKRYVLIQDELDEVDPPDGHSLNTTVRVLDIGDLTKPKLVATWTGPTRAIDHNGFTLRNEYYMSNYRRGLVVLDISNPAAPAAEEKLRFDTYIEDPRDTAEFNGAWGTYPY
jgi:choice-of-anchor B domain-containing protein